MAKTPQTDEMKTDDAPNQTPNETPQPGTSPTSIAANPAREPSGVAPQDPRTVELLRLINGGERQMTEALEQLKAAFKGQPTGASEFFGVCIADIKGIAQAVRNGAMNHALYLAEQAK